ncbi:hypothetical protein CLU79DRAFT_802662 [Phycomyces nitens]|nr:hypothetical protein CLU79DRAFT_802662 [Phycomyces nitens]
MTRLMRLCVFLVVLVCLVGLVPADRLQKRASSVPAPVPSGAGSVAPSGVLSGGPSQATSAPNTALNTAPNPVQSGGASGVVDGSVAALPTSASYGNSIYPGQATFIAPTGSKSIKPLYRIASNENVTFIWGYTYLSVRPVQLTLAAVGPQSATVPIATLDGAATSAVWQLKDVPQGTPMMNGYYKIQLYDQRGISAVGQPGWLSPCTTLTIAFYNPESYVPLTDSNYCPTCFYSAARHLRDSFGPLGIAFGLACLTSVLFIYGLQ